MIFRFILLSDEVPNFKREIQIDGDATFFDFYQSIIQTTGISSAEMTSFFLCDERWRKTQEITLVEMDTDSDEDVYVMEESVLNDFLEDEKQKLLFVFDYLTERSLFIELMEIIPGKNLKKAKVTISEGDIPQENPGIEEILNTDKTIDTDENFFGDDVDVSEIDKEGFDGFDDEVIDSETIEADDLY